MKSLFLVLLAISAACARNIFSCLPGSVFLQDCNTCTCSTDGLTAACTDMACPRDLNELTLYQPVLLQLQKVCEPNTVFKVYCNTCGCSSDGTSFSCTRMSCDPEIWNVDGSLRVKSPAIRAKRSVAQEKVCEPRTQFKDYCNTCGCADDGLSYICTRRMCDENIWNKDGSLKIDITKHIVKRSAPQKICEPHSQFKDYCNTCFCNDDGSSYACTRMMCPPEIWNKDGSLKINDVHLVKTRETKVKICEPGSHFNDFCNTCTCSEDGTTYGCTMMMCDENIWNRDGSRKIIYGEKTK